MRHGESVWNQIFNKGKLLLLPKLIMYLAYEALLWPTDDSVFFDSPLNGVGIEQGRELHAFVEAETARLSRQAQLATKGGKAGAGAAEQERIKMLAALCRVPPPPPPKKQGQGGSDGDTEAGREDADETKEAAAAAAYPMTSVLVASNLRRAIQTLTIGLWGRLMRSGEKIHVLSCLQEVTFNVDGLALAARRELPELGGLAAVPELGGAFRAEQRAQRARWYDTRGNSGSKPLFGSNGLKRMRAFCEWAMAREEECVIIGGHSLWFRSFFRTFVPFDVEHVAKAKKMVNCGVVAFVLEAHEGRYRIEPSSIVSLYGGFEGDKKKKK